jgi:bifunctional N-acetylglucosamine-1-phosphate-uridyltransferase/glucosamine-1-phosphate-acetyltransferase GlmU-like protein
MKETLFILPCAGYGRRMGSPISKELLLNPMSQKPYIEFALSGIQKLSMPKRILVVTRAEKKDLIDYLKTKSLDLALTIDIQLIEPSKEWPDTILQSEIHWLNKNVLVLPDTEFAPFEILEQLDRDLDNHDLSLAVFKTSQLSTFGAIALEKNQYIHAEKPEVDLSTTNLLCKDAWNTARAWGLIAFRKCHGKTVFSQMLASTFDHQWRRLPGDVRLHELTRFEDLTRAGHSRPVEEKIN